MICIFSEKIGFPISKQESDMLKQVHIYLIKNLNLDAILLDSMVSCELISPYDRQRLLLTPDMFKVNAQFMHTLHRKPSGCYQKLVECLRSSGQEQLGQTCEASREFDLTSYKGYLQAKFRQKSFSGYIFTSYV